MRILYIDVFNVLVTAKIKGLGDLNSRLIEGNPNNENTIKEIITSLKYFESELLGYSLLSIAFDHSQDLFRAIRKVRNGLGNLV